MKKLLLLVLILLNTTNIYASESILKNNDSKLISLETERLNYVLLNNSNECILSTQFFSNLVSKNFENNEELLEYIKKHFNKIETKFDLNNDKVTVLKLNYNKKYINKDIVLNFFKEKNDCENVINKIKNNELAINSKF